MKDKSIVSFDRARITQILFQEFSTFPIFIDDPEAINRSANILGIKPDSVRHYLRLSGQSPRYSKVLLDADTKINDNKRLIRITDLERAIIVLRINGFYWKEICKQIKQITLTQEAARKRYKRAIEKLSK